MKEITAKEVLARFGDPSLSPLPGDRLAHELVDRELTLLRRAGFLPPMPLPAWRYRTLEG